MLLYAIIYTILTLFLPQKARYFLFILVFFNLNISIISAQNLPKIPQQFNPEIVADYALYDSSILQIISYTEKNRANTNDISQKQAIAFALQWLAGSPNVNITVEEAFMIPILKHKKLAYSNEMLVQYMFGMTKIILQNKEKAPTEKAIQAAGIRNMIYFYEDLNCKPRVKLLRKYKRLEKRNKLEKWIDKKLSNSKK
ncbi:MAG: hypothetical protein ACPG5B_17525 [Chitinophagales bacterium]